MFVYEEEEKKKSDKINKKNHHECKIKNNDPILIE